MRVRTFAALLAVMLLALPVAAQEQRGSIEGIVKDSSGAVLPGVTVEARSITGAVLTATTDPTGGYRFPSLLPGTYTVTSTLAGFQSTKVENIELLLGQIKKVDFTMAVASMTETVQVSAESPLIDVKQSARSTSIRAEQIDLLPKARDFMSVVTQAPGANNEGKSGGVMIDGATTSENRYIIDGAETSDLVSGGSGKVLIADFVEEVQVKSSGYTAEYGGATGGVINVLTKSGTNQFRGNALFYVENSGAMGSPQSTTFSLGQPTLRLNPQNADIAEYITYKADDYSRYEPGGSIGGPIASDKAWFFGAYQPTYRTYKRSVQSSLDPSQTVSKERKDPAQFLSANSTAQLGSKLRTRVAYNNSWSKSTGRLPSLDGSDTLGLNYDYGYKYPNYSLSGQADWIVKPSLFFGFRAGYYKSGTQSFDIPTSPRFIYRTASAASATPVPAQFQNGVGFQNVLTNTVYDHDTQQRASAQADVTWYGNLAGEHTIKGGFQLDHLANSVLSYEAGPYGQVYWGDKYRTVAGPYGYIRFRTNGADQAKGWGFETTGDVSTTNYGLFIQDAWTINKNLTVNLGLRTENEKVIPFGTPESPTTSVDFKFADKLSPRFGFAYDIKGDGRTKMYGSWGIFYDIFKMNLGRGSFGGEKWLEYWYPLNSPDINAVLLAVNAQCPPTCPSNLLGPKIRGPVDYRYPGEFDPSVKPMKSQEASFGVEHQLSAISAVSARYVHKQLDRAVDDTGSFDPNIGEIYVIANPGFGMTKIAFPDLNVPLPKAKRDYDAVELAFEKRMSNNWYIRPSYLWSRLYGNYSGLDQTDENGRQSPNTGRLYDYPLMSFDQKGNPVNGPLATDRPHQVKVQFIYQLPIGTSIGLNQYVASGIPKTREMAVTVQGYPMFYEGRGSDGRMPTYSQTDLYIQHEFKVSANQRLSVSVNVLNLFNQDTATNFYATLPASGYYLDVPEYDIYNHTAPNFDTLAQQQGMKQDPRFMKDSGWQLPRAARFGVKFTF